MSSPRFNSKLLNSPEHKIEHDDIRGPWNQVKKTIDIPAASRRKQTNQETS